MKTTRTGMMGLGLLTAILFTTGIGFSAESSAENHTVWLSGLDLSKMTAGWGKPQIDQSVQSKPITIGGKKFDKGVGTHADSVLYVDLRGTTERFSASVGVDDEVGQASGHRSFSHLRRRQGTVEQRPDEGRRHRQVRRCQRQGNQSPDPVSRSGPRRRRLRPRRLGGRQLPHRRRQPAGHRPARRRGNPPDARAGPGPEDQRAEGLRRPARLALPLPHPLHRRPPDRLCRRESARGPGPRRRDRHHHRQDRPARRDQGPC